MKVKIFGSYMRQELENDLNDWLATHDVEVHSLRYRAALDTATEYSCMVIYTPNPLPKREDT